MPAYQRQLIERGLTQSMSRRGNCLDNAAMESFFGTLKSEFFYLNRFESIEQLQAGIRQYIHYYNHDRIRTKLKGLSPVQYRTGAMVFTSMTVQLLGVSPSTGGPKIAVHDWACDGGCRFDGITVNLAGLVAQSEHGFGRCDQKL